MPRKTPARKTTPPKPRTGKKSSGSTVPRLLAMHHLLQSSHRTWTVPQIQASLAGTDAEFEVDPNTVRRNLLVLERLGWINRIEGRPPKYSGRSQMKPAQGTSAARPAGAPPMRWIPIETFSRDMGETVEDTLSVIHEAHLDALWLGGHWYVLDLAIIDIPDPRHPELGRLRVAAECRDDRLIASPGELSIDLPYDDVAIEATALTLLPDNPPIWIQVQLGRHTYRVHRSLQRSIAAALLGWVTQLIPEIRPGDVSKGT